MFFFKKKIFKVSTTTDIDICFIVNWDLLAAYGHFIFQFVKKDVLITGPLGLLLQPKSPIGNQMQELMTMVMGGEREVGPVPDLKAPSAPPGAAGTCIVRVPRCLHNDVMGERKRGRHRCAAVRLEKRDRWTDRKIEPAEMRAGDRHSSLPEIRRL